MQTMNSLSPAGAHALAAAESRDRIWAHAESEKSPLLEDILATLTPAQDTSWMGGLCWAAPLVGTDGTVILQVHTDESDVERYYSAVKQGRTLDSYSEPITELYSSWYGLVEVRARLIDPAGQPMPEFDWVLLCPVDGSSGIAGELLWGAFPHEAPPKSMSQVDRADMYAAYLAGLRSNDAEAVLDLFSENAVGAGRDYPGDRCVALRNKDEFRSHWDRFFATYEVIDLRSTTFVNRGWYLFSELHWTVRHRRSGESQWFMTADHLHIGSTGKFWVKLGFGTPPEPHDSP